MSTKGQIVIPQGMRDCFPAGEKVFLMRDNKKVLIQPVSELSEQLKEDLEFARRTEEAYRRHERDGVITMDANAFLKELETW